MRYYLSIDGGGSKTDFLLTDEQGRSLAFASFGPGSYIVSGIEHVLSILQKGVGEVTALAGIRAADITSCFIGMAGFGDIPEESEFIKARIRAAVPIDSIFVGNDSETAIAGSLLGKSGIHIIAGTGSIALGVDLEETSIRCGGWHHAFDGDEGSAYWIASRLLEHFTKQADGREPRTLLYSHLMERYHLSTPQQMTVLVVKEWGCAREQIAGVSREVYELGLERDPIALQIYEEAAEELAQMVLAVRSRGHFMEETMVSYSGGVFSSGRMVLDPLRRKLRAGSCVLCEPALSPLAGGILLAVAQSGELPSDEMAAALKNVQN
jgi:N-acetylglucosamine kinase-like BadF-type ATPase